MARKKKDPTPAFPEIEANRHHDTRKNIPTEELRDFVRKKRPGSKCAPAPSPVKTRVTTWVTRPRAEQERGACGHEGTAQATR